jgi:Ca2+-binding RTX toxin-like protein
MSKNFRFQKLTTILFSIIITIGFLSMGNVDAHNRGEGPEWPSWPASEHPVQYTPQEGPGIRQPRCMVQGTPGNDNLSVNGTNCVQGLEGNDTITVTDNKHKHLFPDSGSDTVFGGGGRDFIHDGNPWVTDPTENDKLDGKGGNDVVGAGLGDDTLTGGPGADSFHCGEGSDTITDYNEEEGDSIQDEEDCEQF